MTENVLKYVAAKEHADARFAGCSQLVHNVLETLLRRKTNNGNLGTPRVDIEELVGTLQALQGRRRSSLAPFAEWKRLVDPAAAADALPDERPSPSDQMAWEEHLLDRLLRLVWSYLDQVLWVDAESASYLAPLVTLASRHDRLIVASLNYDTSVESISRRYHLACHTHQSTWHQRGAFPLDSRGTTLLKLHGSVTWQFTDAWWMEAEVHRRGIRSRKHPQNDMDAWVTSPAIVFGDGNKLRPTGPFLDLLFAYKQALGEANRLVVIGYSFRDEHINEPIRFWFNRPTDRELVIINPSFDEVAMEHGELHLASQLLSFEGKPGPKRVHILRQRASEALARLEACNFEVS